MGEVARNSVLKFELSVFQTVRIASRFASRRFPKTVIAAICNFVGRPVVACYTCSNICLHSFQCQVFDC